MAMVYGLIPKPANVLLDIDDTTYSYPQYRADGSKREKAAIAHFFGWDLDEANAQIRAKKKHIVRMTGVEPTLTQTVCALGMPADKWDRIRSEIWRPSQWLTRDPELCQVLDHLVAYPNVGHVVFGTNSPLAVGKEVLATLGVPETFRVFGPESFSCSKPHSRFFLGIAETMQTQPSGWISIGDREISDCEPALAAGFAGAILIQGRDDLVKTIHMLGE